MATKIRVHELATELGRDRKEILDYLESKGITGKTAVSLVPDTEGAKLRDMYGQKSAEEPAGSGSSDRKQPAEEPPKKKKIVRLIRKFDGVELSEKHETTLVKLIDKLETQIKEKTTELQQDNLIDIISSVLTGEEDDTTMHEDSYTEDNDSVAEIGAEPETEEEYFGSDNVESPY